MMCFWEVTRKITRRKHLKRIVIGPVFSYLCRHYSSGQILEGTGSYCISNIDCSEALTEQNLHNIARLYTILSYPVSNERAHHGWVEKRISNIGTPRWPEKAVLGAFVVKRVQEE